MTSGLPIAALISFVAIAFGVYSLHAWIPSLPNGCELPYMYPAYAPIAMWHGSKAPLRPLSRLAARYRVLYYKEGGAPREGAPLNLAGTPVLFIPGSSGKFRQVRSLAMEAAALASSQPDAQQPQLDFFTLDFKEEPSALSGRFIEDQAEFVNDAIRVITVLYQSAARARHRDRIPDRPRFVLVGHSMGGLVARVAIASSNYRDRSVATLLTMAAPHVRAPISFDGDLVGVYDRVNAFWQSSFGGYRRVASRSAAKRAAVLAAAAAEAEREEALANCSATPPPPPPANGTANATNSTHVSEETCVAAIHAVTNASANASPPPAAPKALPAHVLHAHATLRGVAIASISGGMRDALVAAPLADVEALVHPRHGFAVLSASIPHVGLSVDHACVVWCKQLVKRVALALSAAAKADVAAAAAQRKANATRRDGAHNATVQRADALRRYLLPDASKQGQREARMQLFSELGDAPGAIDATVAAAGFLGPLVVNAAALARSCALLAPAFAFAIAALALAGYIRLGSREASSLAQSVSPLFHLVAPRRALQFIAYQLKIQSPSSCALLLLALGVVLLPSSIEGGVASFLSAKLQHVLGLIPYAGAYVASMVGWLDASLGAITATVRGWSSLVLMQPTMGGEFSLLSLLTMYFATYFCLSSLALVGDRLSSGVGGRVKGCLAAAVRRCVRLGGRIGCGLRRALCCGCARCAGLPCCGAAAGRTMLILVVAFVCLVAARVDWGVAAARLLLGEEIGGGGEERVTPSAVDVVSRKYSALHSSTLSTTLMLPIVSPGTTFARMVSVLLLCTLATIAVLSLCLFARFGRPTAGDACTAVVAAAAATPETTAEAEADGGATKGGDGAEVAVEKDDDKDEVVKKAEEESAAACAEVAAAAPAVPNDVGVTTSASTLALIYAPALVAWSGPAAYALSVLRDGAVLNGSTRIFTTTPSGSAVWSMVWSLILAMPLAAHLGSVWWRGKLIADGSDEMGNEDDAAKTNSSSESSSACTVQRMGGTFSEPQAVEAYDRACAEFLAAKSKWAVAMAEWTAKDKLATAARERLWRAARPKNRDRVGDTQVVEMEQLSLVESKNRTVASQCDRCWCWRALDSDYDGEPELFALPDAEGGEVVQLDTLVWYDEAPPASRDAPRVATLCVREAKVAPPLQPSDVGGYTAFRRRLFIRWQMRGSSHYGGGSGGGGGSGSAARRAQAASEVLQVALLLCGVYAAGCCGTSRIYRLRYAAAALATAGLFGAAV